MWIVNLALKRPYTFIVMAILIVLATPFVLMSMATDVLPNINIPVISIIWSYTGFSAKDMADRITSVNERSLTTTVSNIEHIESQSLPGIAIIKLFLQPGASLQTVLSLAERILAAFDTPFSIGEQTVFTSCSVGVVSADSAHHREPADLLRDADAAMYRVKNRGRDSFAVFNQQMRRELSDQIETEGALRNALKRNDELVPYFQPIVDIASGELVALEALIRWRQPNGEVWAPGRFLPAVEGLKLVGRLDMYMLTRVAEILAQPEHIDWPPVQVNLSSYSITRPEFADELLELLKRYGVHPSRISLELTEGALIAEPDLARNTMQSLADNGTCVVLDDFGTGFSSLSYVHQYRFSGLKIDKSFVLELTQSARSRAIVRAIVRMAESLELTVVAEGIEDQATLELLRTIGAAHGQGYHLARPMSLEALMGSALAPRLRALEQ